METKYHTSGGKSPSKGERPMTTPSLRSPNKYTKESPMRANRHQMIEEETERLKNIQSEMETLRSSHASAFKSGPGNLAGSVTDFSPNKFVSPAKMNNTMTPQTTKYSKQDSSEDLRQQK